MNKNCCVFRFLYLQNYLMECPTNIIKYDPDKTSVTLLQDILNKQGVRTVQYELLQIEGAVSAPSFQYRVTDGRFVAYGQG